LIRHQVNDVRRLWFSFRRRHAGAYGARQQISSIDLHIALKVSAFAGAGKPPCYPQNVGLAEFFPGHRSSFARRDLEAMPGTQQIECGGSAAATALALRERIISGR
jgi:hypothetical protein